MTCISIAKQCNLVNCTYVWLRLLNMLEALLLQGLGLQVVEDVQEADFILAHGTEAMGLRSGAALTMKLEDLEKILKQCADRKIPMVVANPDFVTVEARALRVMPGNHATFRRFFILCFNTILIDL